jgi:uncharacterized membrane protein
VGDIAACAVKLIDVLQGKWLGHPLHPAVVHIPLGAWIAAPFLDLAGRHAASRGVLPLVGLYCVGAGLITALLAVPTGVADWTSIKKERPAWKLGLYHMALNALAAVVWAANFGLRLNAYDTEQPITNAVLLTSAVGAVLVIISGYLGTLMVFDHGVAVARQSKKKWRAIAARGQARLPDPK